MSGRRIEPRKDGTVYPRRLQEELHDCTCSASALRAPPRLRVDGMAQITRPQIAKNVLQPVHVNGRTDVTTQPARTTARDVNMRDEKSRLVAPHGDGPAGTCAGTRPASTAEPRLHNVGATAILNGKIHLPLHLPPRLRGTEETGCLCREIPRQPKQRETNPARLCLNCK